MKKWLLIVIGTLVIGLISYIIIKDILREEVELTFPNTVVVQNTTEYPLDKIVKTISYNILLFDTINIAIVKMPKHMEDVGDINVKAYVYKNIFQDKAYLIFLSSTLKSSEYKMVIAHEMSHIDQMERGDLIQTKDLSAPYVIYKGDSINFHDVPYKQRAHEIDANKQEDEIYKQLEKVLYK